MPRLMSWTVACLAAALQISTAEAQGNIDAGKTPAQIFGDTCAGCHRSARELRRASASFLRSHYTAGSDEAASMANYLAGVGGNEPRSGAATQPKRPPADVAKQTPGRPAVEQPKSAAAPTTAAPAPSATQPQPKSRPTTSAQARALPDTRAVPEARAFQEERRVEPTLSAAPPPPAAVLQPFEE